MYFYPAAMTPGCTKEACAFEDNLARFKATNAAVFGISILDEASKAHKALTEHHLGKIALRIE